MENLERETWTKEEVIDELRSNAEDMSSYLVQLVHEVTELEVEKIRNSDNETFDTDAMEHIGTEMTKLIFSHGQEDLELPDNFTDDAMRLLDNLD